LVGQITVFSGPERRRRWSVEQRLRILTEAFAPGASVSDVARRYDVSTGQIYTWRKRLRVKAVEPVAALDAGPAFAEAVVIEDQVPAPERFADAAVLTELPGGRRVTIYPGASPSLATAVLKALR
jgi:transposase